MYKSVESFQSECFGSMSLFERVYYCNVVFACFLDISCTLWINKKRKKRSFGIGQSKETITSKQITEILLVAITPHSRRLIFS